MKGRKRVPGRRRRGREPVRPTQARVREAILNLLSPVITGARFLDLCAGTGTMGLAALEHGASEVVFIELDPERCREIRRAVKESGLAGQTAVLCGDALRTLRNLAGRAFDLVYLDPPYESDLGRQLLAELDFQDQLAPGGMVLIEAHHKNPPPPRSGGLVLTRTRRYGETLLSFYGRD